jgi:hypothetical protein
MYATIRKGKLLNDRKYIFLDESSAEISLGADPSADEREVAWLDSFPDSAVASTTSRKKAASSEGMNSQKLTVYVTARAYPDEDGIRGRRRAGGIVLHVPTWNVNDWRATCHELWKGQRFRVLPDGQTVLMPFSYTRPSAPRCHLYAACEALRVCREWVRRGQKNSILSSFELTLVTDSNYVVDMVSNTTKLLEWGYPNSQQTFVYASEGTSELPKVSKQRANIDILYPLARAYYDLQFYHWSTASLGEDADKENITKVVPLRSKAVTSATLRQRSVAFTPRVAQAKTNDAATKQRSLDFIDTGFYFQVQHSRELSSATMKRLNQLALEAAMFCYHNR